MYSYQVFHNPQNPAVEGGVFRLYHGGELRNPALLEDSGHFHPQESLIRFSQQNVSFEFCGAGALALAHQLAGENKLYPEFQRFTSSLGYPFWLGSHDGHPAVRVLPSVLAASPRDIGPYPGCPWFAREAVFAIAMTQQELVEFDANEDFQRLLTEGARSALCYCLDSAEAHIYFRYFTSFNNKLEDSATGSAFRYLSALLPAGERVYEVSQLSASGAQMRCQTLVDGIIFWGEVREIPTKPGGT